MIRTALAIVVSSLLFAVILGCLTQGNSSIQRYLTTAIPGWFGWRTTLGGFSGGLPQRILMLAISIGVQLVAFVPALVSFILLSRGMEQLPRLSGLRPVALACTVYAMLQFGFFFLPTSWTSLLAPLYNSLHLRYRIGPPSRLFQLAAASCLAVAKFPCLWSGLAAFCYLSRCCLRPYPVCSDCRYNLTGNVSGRCPECGKEINAADSVE